MRTSSKKTQEYIQKIKISGKQLEPIEDYITNKHDISHRCLKCEFVFKAKPNNVIGKGTKRCPKCFPSGIRISHSEFVKRANIKKPDYEILGKYVNSITHVLVRHKVCGHEWETNPRMFLKKTNCPNCNHRSTKKTDEEFFKEVNEIDSDYKVLDPYINNQTKLRFLHSCGNISNLSPVKFIMGLSRCAYCTVFSNQEKMFNDLLLEFKIVFEKEKVFPSLPGRPFDFLLNGTVLIEIDGNQHFKGWGSSESKRLSSLKRISIADAIKINFSQKKKIKQIRVDDLTKKEEMKILIESLDQELFRESVVLFFSRGKFISETEYYSRRN